MTNQWDDEPCVIGRVLVCVCVCVDDVCVGCFDETSGMCVCDSPATTLCRYPPEAVAGSAWQARCCSAVSMLPAVLALSLLAKLDARSAQFLAQLDWTDPKSTKRYRAGQFQTSA